MTEVSAEALFKLLADPTRLRCLMLMVAEGELCVCELIHALDEIQPKVSRHLALLREAGLVRDRRQGQWIYYRLHPDLPAWVNTILTSTAAGTRGQAPFAGDLSRLNTMTDRPGRVCCS